MASSPHTTRPLRTAPDVSRVDLHVIDAMGELRHQSRILALAILGLIHCPDEIAPPGWCGRASNGWLRATDRNNTCIDALAHYAFSTLPRPSPGRGFFLIWKGLMRPTWDRRRPGLRCRLRFCSAAQSRSPPGSRSALADATLIAPWPVPHRPCRHNVGRSRRNGAEESHTYSAYSAITGFKRRPPRSTEGYPGTCPP